MNTYQYHQHPSFPGFGWITPIMDDACPLIEGSIAEEICNLLNAAQHPTSAPDSPQDGAFPMQPIILDVHGRPRFKKNRIVEDVLEHSRKNGFGLNEIAMGDYSAEERMQFAQLIGYSVSGYGSLSYASDESVTKADTIAAALITKEQK